MTLLQRITLEYIKRKKHLPAFFKMEKRLRTCREQYQVRISLQIYILLNSLNLPYNIVEKHNVITNNTN